MASLGEWLELTRLHPLPKIPHLLQHLWRTLKCTSLGSNNTAKLDIPLNCLQLSTDHAPQSINQYPCTQGKKVS